MSTSVKNQSKKSKSQNKYSIKIQNTKSDDESQSNKNNSTIPQKLTDEEKEEILKQNILLKQIKELEDKLKFEQEQRNYLKESKEKEITQKQITINQMSETNQALQNELEKIQVRIQEKLDKIENKEKNDKNESEKKKEESPLVQLLKVKEKELADSNMAVDKYKKEKDVLRKKLDETINIKEINSLNAEIKIAQEKIEELNEEKKYLNEIKEEHLKCQEEQNKIKQEIKNIQNELNKLKEENKTKAKTDKIKLAINFHNKYEGLTKKDAFIKKEENIKKSLDEFWKINQKKMLSLSNDTNIKSGNELKTTSNNNTVRKNINSLFNKKKKFGEEIRNKNLEISNSNELPIIPLFNNSEKKILLNILPEKEIEKFEKRYEIADKEKSYLQRKLVFQTKNLNKENKELENKYELSNFQIKENEEKNNMLEQKMDDQKKELSKLQEKLDKIIKNVEETKKKIREKDEENKNLVKQIHELKIKYEENTKGNNEVNNEEEIYEENEEENEDDV